jgi:uncharacterized membrane protein
MPPGNLTYMDDELRAALRSWYRAGVAGETAAAPG